MSRLDERTRGVTVKRLPVELRVDNMDTVLGEAPNGKLYVISTEGIGWGLKDGTFVTNDYDPDARKWTPEELKAAAGEEVDLADFIRTFGDRLERNFSIWRHALTGDYDPTWRTAKEASH